MTPLRGRARRAASAAFATVLAGGAMVASATVAGAEDDAPQVQTFDAADFESAAAELPDGLATAVERDLGLSAEEYLANATAAKVAADVVSGLRADGVGVNTAEIDGQELTIYVESDSDVEAAEATGAKVVKGEPEQPSGLEPKTFYPAADFKGGFGYGVFFDDGTGGRCSNGFNGTSGDSLVTFTAGHCGEDFEEGTAFFEMTNDAPVFNNNPAPTFGDQVGVTGPMHFNDADANDGGLLNITEEGWTAPPTVSAWGGGTGSRNDGEVNIYDATTPVVGQPACKSGATSGWQCGEVLHEVDTVTLGENPETDPNVQGFIFNACLLSGDSGGSVVSGNYALGVNSFSTAATGDVPSCEPGNWDPATEYNPEDNTANGDVGGAFALSSDFPGQNGEALFNDAFDLSIFVGQPALNEEQFADDTPTISGTVNAAIGSMIDVVISGDAIDEDITLQATVGDDQDSLEGPHAWEVSLDEALPFGEYTYTATASHTAHGASTPTTSEAATGTFEVVEPPVEELLVESPSNGQTVESGNPRPSFSGTGHPGGEVTLTVGDEAYGSATVGDEGNWVVEPNQDLPIGVRFDATLTQVAEEDEQSVTVSDLGITVEDVTITTPEDGAEVTGNVVFEGTAHPGSDVGLLLEPVTDSADASLSAASGDAAPAQEDDIAEWEGEFEIDDEGNWTFTPDEPIAAGEYTITAAAQLPDGDEDLSTSQTSVTFTVIEKDDDGDGGLPDTGTSNMPFIVLGIGLVVAGGAFVTFRAIRGRSMA